MSCLIEFQRIGVLETPDLGEKLANLCLKPLRLACGRMIEVSYHSERVYQEQEPSGKICRIFWAAVSLILIPFTILGIFVAAYGSSSYWTLQEGFFNRIAASVANTEAFLPKREEPSQADLFQRYHGWLASKIEGEIPQAFFVRTFTEAKEVYGRELAQRLFSFEHEQKILSQWASFIEIREETKTPMSLIETRPSIETEAFVEKVEKQIEASQGKSFQNAHEHLVAISDSSDELRRQINAEALRDLRKALIQEVGIDLAQEILADWNLIGRDIQENAAILSLERKGIIIEAARRAKENQDQLNEIFEQLKRDLARDLPVHEAYIFRRYPQLSDLLSSMPESKTKILHQIMAKALLQKEVANPTAFVGPLQERRVVGALGFSLEKYEEREKIHATLVQILDPLFKQVESSAVPLDQLKQEIEQIASRTRLLAAEVPPENVEAMQDLATFYRSTQNKLNEHVAPFSKIPESHLSLEKAKKFVTETLLIRNEDLVISLLNWFLKRNKEMFFSSPKETRKNLWEEKIAQEKCVEKLEKKCSDQQLIEKALRWFSTYQDFFIHEFDQGENPAEILRDGVCYGLVHRLARLVFLHPQLPIHELKVDSILPSDRLLQAFAGMNLLQGNRAFTLPDSVKRRQGLGEIILFAADTPQDIAIGIATHAEDFKHSQGGMILIRDNHATFLCIDAQNGRYFLFDPNWGTLVFERKPEELLEDLAIRMAVCYNDLYEWAYSSKGALIAKQLVTFKEPKE